MRTSRAGDDGGAVWSPCSGWYRTEVSSIGLVATLRQELEHVLACQRTDLMKNRDVGVEEECLDRAHRFGVDVLEQAETEGLGHR